VQYHHDEGFIGEADDPDSGAEDMRRRFRF